ncbi:hypothetical protein CLOP_g5310 [Closterium sp. NIES-67]|nr:hypothetical protein CLOP_g5310 [Closterium sp. NIES-67]
MLQDLKNHEDAKLESEKKLTDIQIRFSELELCNARLEHKLASKDAELEMIKAEHRVAVETILQDLKHHQDTKSELDEKAASMKSTISELELQNLTLKEETEQLKSEVDEGRTYKNEMELTKKRLLHHETTLIQMRSLAKRLRNEKNELLEKVELLKSANEEQEDSNSSQVQALAQKLRMVRTFAAILCLFIVADRVAATCQAKSELAVWKERCLNQNLKFTSTEDIECSASAVTGRLLKVCSNVL